MKRLFLVTALLLGAAIAASVAEARMKVSTTSFTTNHSTVSIGRTDIIAVRFSTGSVFDFVDIIDSSTTLNSVGAPSYRFYNDNVISTSTIRTLGSGLSRGSTVIPLYRGAIAQPSSALYNGIDIFYDDFKP